MRDNRRRELTPREVHSQRRKEQIARRRLVAALIMLGLVILIIVLVATCGGSDNQTAGTTTSGDTTTTTLGAAEFTAELTGDDTEATGLFTMTYDPDTGALSYELVLDGVDSPTVANIYETADDGSEGLVVYVLYVDDAESGEYTGRLADGEIDEADLTGSVQDGTLGDLIQLIRDGKAYVAVGTADTPTEAIRGDLIEMTIDTTDGDTDTTDEDSDTTEDTSEDNGDTTETTEEE